MKQIIESYRPELIDTLSSLIRIPSVKQAPQEGAPFGRPCAQALDFVLEKAREMGFRTCNLDHYIGYAEYGQGEECFGILCHLDVVPAGTGWDQDPYGAQIVGERMFGRGTLDNKGPAVSALYALKAVKEAGLPLGKRVRIIFGCDEESGWEDIAYYRRHEPLPETAISPDGEYPIVNAERGILHADISCCYEDEDRFTKIVSIRSGTRANVVPNEAAAQVKGIALSVAQAHAEAVERAFGVQVELKKEQLLEIVVRGRSSHAAMPEGGNNALTALLTLLLRLPLEDCEALRRLKRLSEAFPHGCTNGAGAGIACSSEQMGALTASLDLMDLDEEGFCATVDVRHPENVTFEQIIDQLDRKTQLGVSVRHTTHPHFIDKDSPLVRTLLSIYAEETGLEPYCIAIGGGTYARAIDNAVTFGCLFPGEEDTMHQANESVLLENLMINTRILAQAIAHLAK